MFKLKKFFPLRTVIRCRSQLTNFYTLSFSLAFFFSSFSSLSPHPSLYPLLYNINSISPFSATWWQKLASTSRLEMKDSSLFLHFMVKSRKTPIAAFFTSSELLRAGGRSKLKYGIGCRHSVASPQRWVSCWRSAVLPLISLQEPASDVIKLFLLGPREG